MRKKLKISEYTLNKLIDDGLVLEIDNIKRIQKYNSIKIEYEGITYESKNKIRRELKIPEKKLNKMIEEGIVKIIQNYSK